MNHNRYAHEIHSTVNSAFTQAVYNLRHVPFPYFYLNPSGNILFANQHAVKLIGYSLTEIVNRTFDNFLRIPIQTRLLALSNQILSEPLDIALSLQSNKGFFNLRAKIIVDVVQASTITGFHIFILESCPITENNSVEDVDNYEQLLEHLKLQTNFVHDFLHDLKTPLSTLSTSLYLLKRSAKNDMAHHIQVMAMQIEHLKEMILAAASYSQVAQFDSSLNGQIWSISDIVQQSSASFAYRLEAKGIELRVKPFIRDCHVIGDRTRLLQVFSNLFENAYRYTTSGSVLVTVHPDYERLLVYIIIQDTGIGIPVVDLPKIFDRFYRAANAKAHAPVGTGLGLSIVRQIIEQHNGEIEVFSRQNIGTSVVLMFPLVL
jgi:signal transduction histidine kinase